MEETEMLMTTEQAIEYLQALKNSLPRYSIVAQTEVDTALGIAINTLEDFCKPAKWELNANWDEYQCSKCKNMSINASPFCPSCGSMMEVEE